MPMTDLTPLPTAPSRDDPPDVFIERADAWVAAMATLTTQVNTLVSELEATAALIAVAPAYADAGLLAMTGKTPAADRLIYLTGTGAGASALATLTAAGRALVDDATAGDQLTTLGLSANGKSLVTAADYAAMKVLLALVIGTDVQAYDADLAAIAGLTSAADKGIQFTGSGTAGTFDLTSFAKTLLDDANATAALGTLGISTSTNSLTIAGYIIKWGSGVEGSNSFPVAFPNTCDAVIYSNTANPDNADDNDETLWVSPKSTTGFTLNVSGNHNAVAIDWVAFGT